MSSHPQDKKNADSESKVLVYTEYVAIYNIYMYIHASQVYGE